MKKIQVKIVSDVMCPWCVVGYKNLASAINSLKKSAELELADIELPEIKVSWHPFELNPHMPEQGQDVEEHLAEKYGITPEQSVQNRQHIAQAGQNAGFNFHFSKNMRMINSFDCHRLLAWSETLNKQTELQMALFEAHFTDNRHLNDQAVLADIVSSIGLDGEKAAEILSSDQFADQVRQEMAEFQRLGIHSVPTFIINDQYAISGGQPVEAFQNTLRQIVASDK